MIKLNLQLHASEKIIGKIERKYMAHLLNTAIGEETPNWVRLGKDLEELNIELNPDTETKEDVTGAVSSTNSGYSPTIDAETFYAVVGDPLFEKLQEIVDHRYKDDTHCKTEVLEVHMWEGDVTAGFVAWKEDCYVTPKSYGGSVAGYQIPYQVDYTGNRVKGLYVPGTKKFTPEE